jgi:hypothetical protein
MNLPRRVAQSLHPNHWEKLILIQTAKSKPARFDSRFGRVTNIVRAPAPDEAILGIPAAPQVHVDTGAKLKDDEKSGNADHGAAGSAGTVSSPGAGVAPIIDSGHVSIEMDETKQRQQEERPGQPRTGAHPTDEQGQEHVQVPRSTATSVVDATLFGENAERVDVEHLQAAFTDTVNVTLSLAYVL